MRLVNADDSIKIIENTIDDYIKVFKEYGTEANRNVAKLLAINAIYRLPTVLEVEEKKSNADDGRWEGEFIVKNGEFIDELVRCKDCKYTHMTYGGECKYCDNWVDDDGFPLELYLDGDFFCGSGEKE